MVGLVKKIEIFLLLSPYFFVLISLPLDGGGKGGGDYLLPKILFWFWKLVDLGAFNISFLDDEKGSEIYFTIYRS